MTLWLAALETETHHELPFPPYVFGIIAFALLLALMVATLAMGKGRPHS